MHMDKSTLMPKVTSQGLFYSLGSVALLIIALTYFENIFKPLVIALLIWFIIKQIKDWLGRISVKGKSLPAGARSILTFLIITLVIYLIAEIIIRNIEMIIAAMPEYMSRFDETFKQLSATLNDPEYTQYLQKWINSLDLAGMATSLLNSLSGVLTDSMIVVIYVIFLLLEESAQKLKLEKLFPERGRQYDQFITNFQNISDAVRSYLGSKTLISLITAAVSYIILLLLKVDYAFLWSFLVFILNFIPYIGPFISSLIPAIFSVLITGDLLYFIYVFGALEGIQVVLGNLVEPRMMSKSTNLGAVTVVVSLAFWGMLWGIVGMFLAVPVTAIIVIILGQIPATRYVAILLSEKGEVSR